MAHAALLYAISATVVGMGLIFTSSAHPTAANTATWFSTVRTLSVACTFTWYFTFVVYLVYRCCCCCRPNPNKTNMTHSYLRSCLLGWAGTTMFFREPESAISGVIFLVDAAFWIESMRLPPKSVQTEAEVGVGVMISASRGNPPG